MSLEQDAVKHLQEFLVTDAPVEDLLHKHLLIWIFELLSLLRHLTYILEEIVSMRIDGLHNRIERLNALDATVYQL